MITKKTNYSWNFQRIGGLDQVILNSAEDFAHIDELDPKLWVALSCPASGLEFDDKTLALLDDDKDGRIRIPDVIDAVNWLRERLTPLDSIRQCADELPLSVINAETEEGKRLLATAKAILVNVNRANKETISLGDLNDSTIINANNLFNGDGIVPATSKIEPELQTFITDAMNVMGGVKDASGFDGINQAIAAAFKQSLREWLDWRNSVGSTITPLGDDTAEAWQLVQDLKDKIDDYFLRTELASYAPQAQSALNVDEKYIVPTDNGLLEDAALAELPLSRVAADKPLALNSGLNPVWQRKVVRLAELITPFTDSGNELTRQEWIKIQDILSPYTKIVLSKPGLANVDVTIEPKITIDKLGEDRINQLLNSDLFERFNVIAEKDSTTPAAAADIADVERLVIYHKHLYRLLMNFVSFHDFFDLDRKAAFQAGKLFIDGRCCSLCLLVSDVNKHTTLASYSELFLLYCECTRKHSPLTDKQETKTIVAAVTAGDGDFLLDGRNAVFIDNEGHDWDAKIVKVITKPISISQAIWSPYKRIGRVITEQINKWVTSKDIAITNSATTAIQNASTNTSDTQKFDIGKSVGIFAAIGLAVGAIGTAFASITSSLLQLQWWQIPFVFLAIFLVISGPSVILAWLKLRQRTLAPLLEASGWAINGRIKINFILGSLLTSKAELPKNAKRSMIDPTRKRYAKYWLAFFFALLVGCGAVGYWLWHQGYFGTGQEMVAVQSEIQKTVPALDKSADIVAEKPSNSAVSSDSEKE